MEFHIVSVIVVLLLQCCNVLSADNDGAKLVTYVATYSQNHGPKAELSENNTYARRYEGGCWAVCITEQALGVNETLHFNITERETGWLSNMNVGVLYTDPEDLPLGSLVICDDNVSASLPDTEVFIFKRFYSDDDVYQFRVDDKGAAYLTPNVTYNDVIFTGVNVTRKFWVIFNIYGDTKAIKLLGKSRDDNFTFG